MGFSRRNRPSAAEVETIRAELEGHLVSLYRPLLRLDEVYVIVTIKIQNGNPVSNEMRSSFSSPSAAMARSDTPSVSVRNDSEIIQTLIGIAAASQGIAVPEHGEAVFRLKNWKLLRWSISQVTSGVPGRNPGPL